jgi:hypothetical protein
VVQARVDQGVELCYHCADDAALLDVTCPPQTDRICTPSMLGSV